MLFHYSLDYNLMVDDSHRAKKSRLSSVERTMLKLEKHRLRSLGIQRMFLRNRRHLNIGGDVTAVFKTKTTRGSIWQEWTDRLLRDRQRLKQQNRVTDYWPNLQPLHRPIVERRRHLTLGDGLPYHPPTMLCCENYQAASGSSERFFWKAYK